jgi:hypothetical protein
LSCIKATGPQGVEKALGRICALNGKTPGLDIGGVAPEGRADFDDSGIGLEAGQRRVDPVARGAGQFLRGTVDIGLRAPGIGAQGVGIGIGHGGFLVGFAGHPRPRRAARKYFSGERGAPALGAHPFFRYLPRARSRKTAQGPENPRKVQEIRPRKP